MKLFKYPFLLILLVAAMSCRNTPKTSQNKVNEEFPSEMVSFTPIKNNPVFIGTGSESWDKKIRERGFILFEGGQYKMWYTGYNDQLAKERFLGYATSSDGIHWEKYPYNPVFRKKWTEDVFVIKNEGTYYMYAEGEKDVAHWLSSPDGIHWEEQGDLIIQSTKGDTIPGPYGTPTVWIENGKWYLFYERDDMGIWVATSTNKGTWKNIQDNPVIKTGPDKYDIGAIAANQVVKFNGRFYIYYHATDRLDWQHPSSPVFWSSNVAMSYDLIHWTKFPGNPITKGNHSSPILVFDGQKPCLYTMHSEVWRYNPR